VTLGRALACAVVAAIGLVFLTFGGVLLTDRRNGRMGSALMCALGAMLLTVVVLAIAYGEG
jgi:hypothetical protein